LKSWQFAEEILIDDLGMGEDDDVTRIEFEYLRLEVSDE